MRERGSVRKRNEKKKRGTTQRQNIKKGAEWGDGKRGRRGEGTEIQY